MKPKYDSHLAKCPYWYAYKDKSVVCKVRGGNRVEVQFRSEGQFKLHRDTLCNSMCYWKCPWCEAIDGINAKTEEGI